MSNTVAYILAVVVLLTLAGVASFKATKIKDENLSFVLTSLLFISTVAAAMATGAWLLAETGH